MNKADKEQIEQLVIKADKLLGEEERKFLLNLHKRYSPPHVKAKLTGVGIAVLAVCQVIEPIILVLRV